MKAPSTSQNERTVGYIEFMSCWQQFTTNRAQEQPTGAVAAFFGTLSESPVQPGIRQTCLTLHRAGRSWGMEGRCAGRGWRPLVDRNARRSPAAAGSGSAVAHGSAGTPARWGAASPPLLGLT